MNGDFKRYEHGAIAYAWYIWEKGFTGEPRIRWIGENIKETDTESEQLRLF